MTYFIGLTLIFAGLSYIFSNCQLIILNYKMNIRTKEEFLTVEQVAKLLKLPEVTIQRWEHQGKIPCKIIDDKLMFKKSEIIKWAQTHDLAMQEQQTKKSKQHEFSLVMAIENGKIYHNIPGEDIYTVFQNALQKLPFINKSNLKSVLEALIDREELNSTGIGNGIAIPHTRNRIELGITTPYVAVFFLESPIKYSAIDDEAVFVLFMIFTTSVKEHLKILSKISFVLQQKRIREILQQKNSNNNLLSTIDQLENGTL